VERYKRAWASNDPTDIGDLFTDDAAYFTAPFRESWRGRQAIIAGWLGRKDDPGSYQFSYEVLGATDSLAFVQGRTSYPDLVPPKEYSNLWVLRLTADGRCSEFTEWWMEHTR